MKYLNWPDGHVCLRCHSAARRRRGLCSACGTERMVPGQDSAGNLLCIPCSGLKISLTCEDCGEEAALYQRARCYRCHFKIQLKSLLDDGSGDVSPELRPLFDALVAMKRAESGYQWLRNPRVRTLLSGLSSGEVELSHAGLDGLEPSRSVEYIRDLLMQVQALPHRDRHVAAFERWLPKKLDSVPDEELRRVIDRFARWHLLRQLRTRSSTDPAPPSASYRARQTVSVSIEFVSWLRDRGADLGGCNQHHVDEWFASPPTTRRHVDTFLYWARSQRLVDRMVTIPANRTYPTRSMSQSDRLVAVRTLVVDDAIELGTRVAGLLLLLCGVRLTQVLGLGVADVVADQDGVTVQVAGDPIPLPYPLDGLILELAATRPNMQTAANASTSWLFPGGMPGQPLSLTSMLLKLKNLGIKITAAKNAALTELAKEVPAPVLARALGYIPVSAVGKAREAGADWMSYVAIRTPGTDRCDP